MQHYRAAIRGTLDRRQLRQPRGKGTHRVIHRLQGFAQRHRYVLRMDVVQHFPSLDHAILRAAIVEVVHDEDVLWLVDTILASGAGVLTEEYDMVYFPSDDPVTGGTRPAGRLQARGLPIGNLTSQFWSNVYMNALDWYVIRDLGCPAYLRYVDDFASLPMGAAALGMEEGSDQIPGRAASHSA